MNTSLMLLRLVDRYENGDLKVLGEINEGLKECLELNILDIVKKYNVPFYFTLSDLFPYLKESDIDLNFLIRLNNLVKNPNADTDIYVSEKMNFIRNNSSNIDRIYKGKIRDLTKGVVHSEVFNNFRKAQ